MSHRISVPTSWLLFFPSKMSFLCGFRCLSLKITWTFLVSCFCKLLSGQSEIFRIKQNHIFRPHLARFLDVDIQPVYFAVNASLTMENLQNNIQALRDWHFTEMLSLCNICLEQWWLSFFCIFVFCLVWSAGTSCDNLGWGRLDGTLRELLNSPWTKIRPAKKSCPTEWTVYQHCFIKKCEAASHSRQHRLLL